MKYEPVIGLEVHIELSTKSKMFCACSADYFGKEPNTHTCPVCLGFPGAMPVANQEAIRSAQKFGLALDCQLLLNSKFDRKNYFYPDLAKGFQISQYDLPFSKDGTLSIQINNQTKKIGITRAHLEEDTGKLTHSEADGEAVTLIDFNRSGVPLMEVVSEPQLNSAEEAKAYAQKLQQIVRYLEISDADMEKGSMRIEPNVSLREIGQTTLPTYKVELKNINSFRFAEKAINFEISRQSEILERGETPVQETRGWNESKSVTFSQRSKEEAHDYRYFPEPDLPPMSFAKDYSKKLLDELPELPERKFERFKKEYELKDADIEILTRDKELADFFEEAVRVGSKPHINPQQIANFLINKKPDINKFVPATIVKIIVSAQSQSDISEEDLEKAIGEIISENGKIVEDFKKGNTNAIQALIGKAMAKAKGKLNPQKAKEILLKHLG